MVWWPVLAYKPWLLTEAVHTCLLIGQFYSGRISNNGTAAIAQAIATSELSQVLANISEFTVLLEADLALVSG